MPGESLFHANLDLIGDRSPRLRELIEGSTVDPRARVVAKRFPGIEYDLGNAKIFSNSLYDPYREADEFLTIYGLDRGDNIFVLGIGTGYLVERLLDKAPKEIEIYLAVYDPGPLALIMGERDLSKIFADPRIRIVTGSDREIVDEFWRISRERACFFVIDLRAYHLQKNLGGMERTVTLIGDISSNYFSLMGEYKEQFIENVKANMVGIEKMHGVSELFGRFHGKSAVIVGAGPSLDRDFAALRAIRGRVTVIAIGQALPKFIAASMKPDFVVYVDTGEVSVNHFADGGLTIGCPLIYTAETYRGIVSGYTGRKYIAMDEFSPFVKGELKKILESKGVLTHGGSVSNVAVDCAAKMGFDRIILVGMDFSFPGGATHFSAYNQQGIADISGDQIPTVSFSGDTVGTRREMNVFREWIERYARTCRSTLYASASTGALIRGVVWADIDRAGDAA